MSKWKPLTPSGTHTLTQDWVNGGYGSAHSEQHHHTVALLLNQAYNQHSSKGKKKGPKGINTPEYSERL